MRGQIATGYAICPPTILGRLLLFPFKRVPSFVVSVGVWRTAADSNRYMTV